MTQGDESDTGPHLREEPPDGWPPLFGLREVVMDMNGNVLIDRVRTFNGMLTRLSIPLAHGPDFVGGIMLSRGQKLRVAMECVEPPPEERE